MSEESDIIPVREENRDELTNSLLASAQSNEQLSAFIMHLGAHNFAMGSLEFNLMSEAAERLRSYS